MRSVFALLMAASPVAAQDTPLPLNCEGVDWSLEVTEDGSSFDYVYSTDLDIALETTAQDGDYPRALTLIGRGDSAILILENQSCDGGDFAARVLTQRGETPVLLTGCCAP